MPRHTWARACARGRTRLHPAAKAHGGISRHPLPPAPTGSGSSRCQPPSVVTSRLIVRPKCLPQQSTNWHRISVPQGTSSQEHSCSSAKIEDAKSAKFPRVHLNMGHEAKHSDGGCVDRAPYLVRPPPSPSSECEHWAHLSAFQRSQCTENARDLEIGTLRKDQKDFPAAARRNWRQFPPLCAGPRPVSRLGLGWSGNSH